MDHLDEISVGDLQRALASVDEKTPALRLVVAIAYKQGISQSALADWLDVERKTIYNWLMRFEERGLESAVRDAPRPGRPGKLSHDQRGLLEEALERPPSDTGIDAPAWTTALVQRFIREEFDVEYSQPSCRRLMREAGLRYRPTRAAIGRSEAAGENEAGNRSKASGPVWLPA